MQPPPEIISRLMPESPETPERAQGPRPSCALPGPRHGAPRAIRSNAPDASRPPAKRGCFQRAVPTAGGMVGLMAPGPGPASRSWESRSSSRPALPGAHRDMAGRHQARLPTSSSMRLVLDQPVPMDAEGA